MTFETRSIASLLVAPVQSQTVRRLGTRGVRVGSAQLQGWSSVTEDVHSLKSIARGTVVTVCDGDGGVGAAALVSRSWIHHVEHLPVWDTDNLRQAVAQLTEALLNWPPTQDGRSRTDMVSAIWGPPLPDGTAMVNMVTVGQATWGHWTHHGIRLHRGSGPGIGAGCGPDLIVQATVVPVRLGEHLFLTTVHQPVEWWVENMHRWGNVWPEPSRVASRVLDEALLAGVFTNMTLAIVQPGPSDRIAHQCFVPGPFYNGPHLDPVWRQAYLHDAWSAGVSGRVLWDQAWGATMHSLDLEFARWTQDPQTLAPWLSTLHAHQDIIRQLAFHYYCTDCQRQT